ncbi:MAG: hypothetical protein V3T72_01975 [Thermoanaerobaculia bacterium]
MIMTLRIALLCSLALGLTQTGCGPPTQTPPPVSHAEVAPPEAGPAEAAPAPACAGGAIKDDGSVETGYGFVPSAVFGEYLQEFHADEFPSAEMETVCVCWLKTRGERDIGFEIVFYEDAGGRPANTPYEVVPVITSEVADGVETAGGFVEVDVTGVTLAPGISYIGARWNPSEAKFLFICTDTSDETELVNVFFREDRARGWANAIHARDPVFANHRSILVRARAKAP